MPPARQIIDPLWHLLCPAFSRPSPLSTARAVKARRPTQRPFSAFKPRCQHPPEAQQQVQTNRSNASSSVLDTIINWDTKSPFSKTVRYQSAQFNRANEQRFRRKLIEHGTGHVDEIYNLLAGAAEHSDAFAVLNWVHFLITARGQKPNYRIYLALLKASAHPEHGSADEVERIFKEMEENGVHRDAAIYEAALRALAIHPSYTMRTTILEEMKSNWFGLSANGWHYVCCAQVREKQIELAQETLYKMENDFGIVPRTWLLDLLAHVLADVGDMDALSGLISVRLAGNHSRPSHILWLQILSKAAEKLHHPIVGEVWRAMVMPGHINPSTGLCTMVLNTAARAGDDNLAIDVFRVLGNRSSPIHAYHYEALIATHLKTAEVDLLKVLMFMSIMENSEPSVISKEVCRPLLNFLKENPAALESAVSHLRKLRSEKKVVPVAVSDAILEAALEKDGVSRAVEICQDLPSASLPVLNRLLAECATTKRKQSAIALARCMATFRTSPNPETYNLLILSCLRGDEADNASDANSRQRHLNDAFSYYTEMEVHKHEGSEDTLRALATAAAGQGDKRYRTVLGRMHGLGYLPQSEASHIHALWPRSANERIDAEPATPVVLKSK